MSDGNSGVDPVRTIHELRAAVAKNPHDAVMWAALIHMVGPEDDWADQTSRTALKLNPASPEILVARAAESSPSSALEILADLGKIPGHREEADRYREILSLGLLMPPRSLLQHRFFYCEWADHLLYLERFDRAAAVLQEGLATTKDSRFDTNEDAVAEIQGRMAMVLALQGKFAESAKLQESQGFVQISVEWKYCGLADVLLLQHQPAMAIKSLGGHDPGVFPPEQTPEGADPRGNNRELSRVLAYCEAQVGHLDRAEKLLGRNPDDYDRLIQLQIAVDANENDRADRLGDDIVRDLAARPAGGGFTTSHAQLPPPHAAASLEKVYIAAVQWLVDNHPADSDLIESAFGSPARVERVQPQRTATVVPASERLAKSRADFAAAIADTDPRRISDSRRELVHALMGVRRFDEAARTDAPFVVDPTSKYDRARLRLDAEAAWWSLLRRRADTEALFEKDPATLESAREIFWNGDHTNADRSSTVDGLTIDQRFERLVKVGPGVLSIAERQIQLGQSSFDRTLYPRLIGALGGPQDAPVLIEALFYCTIDDTQTPARARENLKPEASANAAAFEAALEKVTGLKPEMDDALAHMWFWLDWWEESAASVVAKSNEGSG